MTNTCTYLNSKPRYEILDGLRGVSAMMVVAFHLFETYSDGVPYQIINHGYLAVDFFFVLSGFVIGYAYDDRWDKMNTWSFFKRRLIRLHPMLVCGTLIGTCFFYFGGDHPDFSMINEVSVWTLLMITLVCITMYPLQQSLDIRGWGEMNPLNGATWSLFWEYLANVAYALFIRHFPKWMLALLVFGSALLTVILCLNIDVFNCLSARSYAQYTVIGGWSLTPDQLQIGVTRLLYPFFMGLLLSRVNRLISVKGAFWWCTMAVIVILAMPRVGGAAESYGNMVFLEEVPSQYGYQSYLFEELNPYDESILIREQEHWLFSKLEKSEESIRDGRVVPAKEAFEKLRLRQK